jgi:Flp pilus assembly protein protease CpaA
MIDILILTITLTYLILTSITDLKTREVPDYLSYSLIFIIIAIELINSLITSNYQYFITAGIMELIFIPLAFIMYYTKQWGGGDTKLIIGISLAIAQPLTFLTTSTLPIYLTFIINLLLAGSIYGLGFSIYLAIKHFKQFKEQLKNHKLGKIKYLVYAITLAIVTYTFFVPDPTLKLLTIALALLIFTFPYLTIFIKAVEKSCMILEVPANKVTEGDWVLEDIHEAKYENKSLGVTKEQLEVIKHLKRSFKVKVGIPFIPSFLLAYLLTIFLGNLFF